MPDLLWNSGHLVCPVCEGCLRPDSVKVACTDCNACYAVEDGIPLLFVPNEGQTGDVTEIVKGFYEENPFPNYDDLDSSHSLVQKAERGVFARLLNEQIRGGATVLEVGCGTGQLTNFLGMSWNRQVFGSDLCLNSLRLGNAFRERNKIKNTRFLQMNLFRPALRRNAFDVVVCNGVLHHTADPLGGFRSISRLVKPGGFIIIGLYNKIGRWTTDFRRFLFRLSGDRLKFLDAHVRNPNYNDARKRAWFLDQYKHPHESKHTYGEVIAWFESNGFEFTFSIPKTESDPFKANERLFEPHSKGTKSDRFFTQVGMLLQGGVDGALFVMIGRKAPEGKVEAFTPAEAASPLADAPPRLIRQA
jgi:SAM-dependent methyltransferase